MLRSASCRGLQRRLSPQSPYSPSVRSRHLPLSSRLSAWPLGCSRPRELARLPRYEPQYLAADRAAPSGVAVGKRFDGIPSLGLALHTSLPGAVVGLDALHNPPFSLGTQIGVGAYVSHACSPRSKSVSSRPSRWHTALSDAGQAGQPLPSSRAARGPSADDTSTDVLSRQWLPTASEGHMGHCGLFGKQVISGHREIATLLDTP